MAAISNVNADGTLRPEKDNDDVIKVLKGNMGWHRDCTYMPVQAKGAVFSAEEVPTSAAAPALPTCARPTTRSTTTARRGSRGSGVSFAALQPVQARPPTKKADGEYSGYGFHDGPVPLRPLVKTHPETGRKSLLIGRHAHNIPGWTRRRSASCRSWSTSPASRRASTTTTGRRATRWCGTIAA